MDLRTFVQVGEDHFSSVNSNAPGENILRERVPHFAKNGKYNQSDHLFLKLIVGFLRRTRPLSESELFSTLPEPMAPRPAPAPVTRHTQLGAGAVFVVPLSSELAYRGCQRFVHRRGGKGVTWARPPHCADVVTCRRAA